MILPANALASINTENTLAYKLSQTNATQWKMAIPILDTDAPVLNEVLDALSPAKTHFGIDEDTDLEGIEMTNVVLGQGTAKVKLGTHLKSGLHVAVKVIEKSRMNETMIQNLIRELFVLGGLQHDHIIPLFQVVDSPSCIYLVMEYEKGGELFSYIQQRKNLAEDEAVYIYRQLVSAVQYCHSQSIVHRDLKPENILLDAHGNVKLGDFGFASLIQKGEYLDDHCGSPEYAAPEMIARKNYVGPEVDIWSLGVILYVMTTGKMPFGASNRSLLYKCIISGQYSTPNQLSDSLQSLIKSILCVDIFQRATMADIRIHPWINMNGKLKELEFHNSEPPVVLKPTQEELYTLEQWGFSEGDVNKYVAKNLPCNVKTALFLLRESKEPRMSNFVLADWEQMQAVLTGPTENEIESKLYSHTPIERPKMGSPGTLFERIRDKSNYPPTDPSPMRAVEPPISCTIVHSTNRKETHLEILKKIVQRGGRIRHFREEEPNVMYATVPVHHVPLAFDFPDDPEMQACLKDDQSKLVSITVTTEPHGQQFVSVFEIVDEEQPAWVLDQFEDTMKGLIG